LDLVKMLKYVLNFDYFFIHGHLNLVKMLKYVLKFALFEQWL
jgi:hypothetical protein